MLFDIQEKSHKFVFLYIAINYSIEDKDINHVRSTSPTASLDWFTLDTLNQFLIAPERMGDSSFEYSETINELTLGIRLLNDC